MMVTKKQLVTLYCVYTPIMNKDYNQLEDFISDDSFLSWVYKTDEKNVALWNAWFAENPQKKSVADEAAAILLQVQLTDATVSDAQLTIAEARLRNNITAEKENSTAKVIPVGRRKVWYSVAAAAIFISVLTIGLQFLFSKNAEKPVLATAYGQIRQDKLPDGTEVTLNANSKLTYPNQWKEGTDREVWIQGEAFFHVKKTAQHNKFIVHTDAFDIEVTGTSFDVKNRNGKSSIILKEGSVKIHRPGQAEILMKPGDQVEFVQEQIQKKTVVKQDYMAWTENKLEFDNTPINDVAEIIREHYGVDVRVKGDSLSGINGIMPNDNLDALLQTIDASDDETVNFSVQRSGNVITIIATKVNN